MYFLQKFFLSEAHTFYMLGNPKAWVTLGMGNVLAIHAGSDLKKGMNSGRESSEKP